MPLAVSKTYLVQPGGTVYAGLTAPPSWLNNVAINELVSIPNTSGAGGAALDAWGTLPLIHGTAKLVSPANGGHQDSSDNRVTMIDLWNDSPAWVVKIANSSNPAPLTTNGVDYYPDGTPTSRHGYHHSYYIPQRNQVIMFGSRGIWSAAGADGYKMDGFNVTEGSWSWLNVGDTSASIGFGSALDHKTGCVWASSGNKWNPDTNTWVKVTTFNESWRWPAVLDSSRDYFFTLQYGDSQGYDLQRGLVATKFHKDTGVQSLITFNESSAKTQLIADAPVYPGMDYDPYNDCFLFYSGIGSQANRIYKITPNSGTVWDISILNTSGAILPPTPNAGVNGRVRYIEKLGGFAIVPSASSNVYFLRTK